MELQDEIKPLFPKLLLVLVFYLSHRNLKCLPLNLGSLLTIVQLIFVMANIDCHLDRIHSHHGNNPLSMPARHFEIRLIEVGQSS